jgi:predicted DsbA family dithiol-disulfide isomerase
VDEWVSYEIHPETPPEGVLLVERFPADMVQGMKANLSRAGEPYGIEFGDMTIMPNTRLALEASEYARDHGNFHDFHEKVFRAYFTENRNIGNMDVLMELAASAGLNTAELSEALADGRYLPRLEQALMEGSRYGITGTPTFIVNNRYKIVGAQPLENFRNALKRIEAEMGSSEE